MTVDNIINQRWQDTLHQCKSTMFCKVYGHSKANSAEDGGYYVEKWTGDFYGGYWTRRYYRGLVEYCTNPRCEYKKFIGEREYYKQTRINKWEMKEYEIPRDDNGASEASITRREDDPGIDHGI